ncbi:16S rRNA (adenine(1518)-N(6)/adenine(1519)-N(6))-dimethyltransferase RsmA [Candidatus Omnitrophota bacterium]
MRAKKHLSQFFLVDKNTLGKIADVIRVDDCDQVLEIGCGRGELTRFLLEKGKPLIGVEIDPKLCEVLLEKLKSAPGLTIVCGDILEFRAVPPNTVVAGNVPYHISFAILEFLVEHRALIKRAYLTLQKEFARKLTACPGTKDYGFISCFIRFYADVRQHFTIRRSCFFPSPKVDSATVEIDLFLQPKVDVADEKRFFRFVKSVFSQRRKKIRNILAGLYPSLDISLLLSGCAIDPDQRPETIPLEKLAAVFNAV